MSSAPGLVALTVSATAFDSVLGPSADPDNSPAALNAIAASQQFIRCLVYGQLIYFARH